MESDLNWWESEFHDASQHEWVVGQAAKYEQRVLVAESVRAHLHRAFHELEQMPRLS